MVEPNEISELQGEHLNHPLGCVTIAPKVVNGGVNDNFQSPAKDGDSENNEGLYFQDLTLLKIIPLLSVSKRKYIPPDCLEMSKAFLFFS